MSMLPAGGQFAFQPFFMEMATRRHCEPTPANRATRFELANKFGLLNLKKELASEGLELWRLILFLVSWSQRSVPVPCQRTIWRRPRITRLNGGGDGGGGDDDNDAFGCPYFAQQFGYGTGQRAERQLDGGQQQVAIPFLMGRDRRRRRSLGFGWSAKVAPNVQQITTTKASCRPLSRSTQSPAPASDTSN